MDKYYVIESSEDGDAFISEYDSKEELLKELNETIEDIKPSYLKKFLDSFKNKLEYYSSNRKFVEIQQFGENTKIIIKGEIIIPKEEKVVTKISI